MVKYKKIYFYGFACALLIACGPSAAEIEAFEKLEAEKAEVARQQAYNQKILQQRKDAQNKKYTEELYYKTDNKILCEDFIRAINPYGVKFKSFIDRNKCTMETKRCQFKWTYGQVKINNQYGAPVDSQAHCFTHNGQVVSLKINGQKLVP